MTTLQDHQFEILPTAEASDGFVFGIGASVSVDGDGFDSGSSEWLTQDQTNSRRGVRGFGRDVLTARTWTWASHVNEEDVESAVESLENLSGYWHPEELVREPGAFTALRYRLAGRDRRIFGRPRRFAAPPSNLILSGFVPVTHDFDLVDAFTYDDIESSVNIPYSSSVEGGGFAFPLTFPVTTQPSEGAGNGQLAIGGNRRTYPIVRLEGPWTNPVFVTDNWTLRWEGEILANDWVEIDCRPWVLTVKNKAGASVVEGLSRRTWLEDCYFAAGSRPSISLAGIASSGAASATVRWRNAWKSI